MNTIYILGAGPTGLGVVLGLKNRSGYQQKLYERNARVGGLAQSILWKGYGWHDLGPHKIYTLNKELEQKILSLIKEDKWLIHEKKSSIYMNGFFLDYPPSPFSLMPLLGKKTFAKAVISYVLASLSLPSRQSDNSFEIDLIRRVGKPIYSALFKPMASKLWGNPKMIDAKLSRTRVQTPSPIEILKNLLTKRKDSNFEALTFKYPKGGLDKIWDAILANCNNLEVQCGSEVTKITVQNNRVVSIEVNNQEIKINEGDQIVSSLPISKMVEIIDMPSSHLLRSLCSKTIKLNDLILVFLAISESKLLKESWVFVPQPSIVFHRISEQASFDPEMVQNGSIVCLEIMSHPDRDFSMYRDEDLITMTLEDMSSMGFNPTVIDSKCIRIPNSYPVYTVGFQEPLKSMIGILDAVENFKTIGRQGAFNYIGTLDALDIGIGYAEYIASDGDWSTERARTEEYPVLD